MGFESKFRFVKAKMKKGKLRKIWGIDSKCCDEKEMDSTCTRMCKGTHHKTKAKVTQTPKINGNGSDKSSSFMKVEGNGSDKSSSLVKAEGNGSDRSLLIIKADTCRCVENIFI